MSDFLSKNIGVVGHLIATVFVIILAIIVLLFVPDVTAHTIALGAATAVAGYWFGSATPSTPQTAQMAQLIQSFVDLFSKPVTPTNTTSTSTPANTTPATPVAAQPAQATPQAVTTNTGENGPELVNLPRGASAQPLQGNGGNV